METILMNCGFNEEVRGELYTLTCPEAPVLKVGLNDKINGASEGSFGA
jgi:hypothetical protein